MKLACTSRSFEDALDRGDLTQLEVLDLAARELGVDGVVLDVRHFPRTDDDYLAQVKKMATDLGLTIAAVESDEFFTADEETMGAILSIATRIGAPLVAGRLGVETALPWSAQLGHLSDASGLAKAANITLAVRNAAGTFAGTATDCKRVSKETDSAWLRYGLEPAAFDGASDAGSLADRTVLLWSSLERNSESTFAEWPEFRGFLALEDASGGATAPGMKNAIHSWRIALSSFILNRT